MGLVGVNNCICPGGGGVRGIVLVILLYEINNIKFSNGEGKGPDPLLYSRSVHEQGMPHNEIQMLLCLNHGIE